MVLRWSRLWVALLVGCVVLAALFVVWPSGGALSGSPVGVVSWVRGRVRVWRVVYRSHTGAPRFAYVDLPRWYGPGRDPVLPLVISPHGRESFARANSALWGDLPALGPFAVVNPQGQGRVLTRASWGDPGQVDDLARMPGILSATLPWLRLDAHRVYAVGGSGG